MIFCIYMSLEGGRPTEGGFMLYILNILIRENINSYIYTNINTYYRDREKDR